MWVWGGLTLSYPQTVAESFSLCLSSPTPPKLEGGRCPLSFSSSLEQDMPLVGTAHAHWTSTPFARSPPSLVLFEHMPEPHPF